MLFIFEMPKGGTFSKNGDLYERKHEYKRKHKNFIYEVPSRAAVDDLRHNLLAVVLAFRANQLHALQCNPYEY